MRKPVQLCVVTSPVLLLAVTCLLIVGEGDCSLHFGFQDQFRIRNLSRKDVAVTSSHTHKATDIPRGKAAIVPHSVGDITIKQRDGNTWVYKNVGPGSLEGTPYRISSRCYIPFGGGTLTVNLILAEDGRLYFDCRHYFR